MTFLFDKSNKESQLLMGNCVPFRFD